MKRLDVRFDIIVDPLEHRRGRRCCQLEAYENGATRPISRLPHSSDVDDQRFVPGPRDVMPEHRLLTSPSRAMCVAKDTSRIPSRLELLRRASMVLATVQVGPVTETEGIRVSEQYLLEDVLLAPAKATRERRDVETLQCAKRALSDPARQCFEVGATMFREIEVHLVVVSNEQDRVLAILCLGYQIEDFVDVVPVSEQVTDEDELVHRSLPCVVEGSSERTRVAMHVTQDNDRRHDAARSEVR